MKKILIIEDDQKIAMVLEIRFHANGYETMTARNSNLEATLARSATPDLIILDISLPDGNGLNLANVGHQHARRQWLYCGRTNPNSGTDTHSNYFSHR